MITTKELYRHFLLSDGISTDSRQLVHNKLFFALKGDHFNGNHYAGKAIDNGCLFAVVDDPSIASGDKYLLVDDTLIALQNLARFHRNTLNIPILGLTGSNGKTTTKELITAVLAKKYNTLSTKGNLNNAIGVPLTLLSIKNHDIAVIEMGANHPGEIRELCEMAKPGYGLITNIGKAHLEGFGSFEGVINTKKELYEYIQSLNGTLFVNFSNPLLKQLAEKNGSGKIVYGKSEKSVCDGKALMKGLYLYMEITWDYNHQSGSTGIQTQLAGSYNLENVIAAIAVGLYFNVPFDDILEAVSNYKPSNNRSQLLVKGSNKLILDAYNANPSSMLEALENFYSYQEEKKLIILGDMLELGKYSREEHLRILQNIMNKPGIEVILVGEEFIKANENSKFKAFSDTTQVNKYLQENPVHNSLILIKGSRGIGLEKIVEIL